MRDVIVLAPLLLVMSVLAGCVGQVEDTTDAAAMVVPSAPSLPSAYDFACPPGKTQERVNGVCVGTIFSNTESNQEPFVAADPKRPNVLAIGVNAGHTSGAVDPQRASPGVDLVLMDFYFTEDGGATWRVSQLPYIPTPHGLEPIPADAEGVVGDPALAFDNQGVLHVSGIATQGGQRGYETFYTSTPDLGRTWSKPVVFTTDHDNDRNWINVGPDGTVYVPWQNIGSTPGPGRGYSEIAWSQDGGKTWKQQTKAQRANDCIQISPVVFMEDQPHVVCAGVDGSLRPTGVKFLRFDPADGSFASVAELTDLKAYWPMVARAVDGSLVIMTERPMKLTRSADNGLTWTKPVPVAGLSKLLGSLSRMEKMWIEADPWGGVQALLRGYDGCVGALGVVECSPWSSRVVHLVLNPANLEVMEETVLTPSDVVETQRVPPSVAPDYGDHYFGVAFPGDRVFLTWTFDAGLDFTTVRPTLSSN